MNTDQINCLLSKYKCFIGTYPRDLLPKYVNKFPCALIINSDDSKNEGEHWIAIFIVNKNLVEYFDSFGLFPIHNDIIQFFKRNNINNIVYNSKQLQSIKSNMCGAYCVLFIKFRCLKLKYCDVIKFFTNNVSDNDIKAYISLLL